MTSREALETLKDEITFSVKNRISPKFIEEDNILKQWNNRFNIIEKDLEVLKILKKKKVDVGLISMVENYDGYPFENIVKDEFDKIKEWLENE